MKTIILLFIFIPSLVYAQGTVKISQRDTSAIQRIFPTDSITGKIMYREVIHVQGQTKQQILKRAQEWLTHTFASSKNVIQYADSNAGKVIAHGVVQAHYTDKGADQTKDVGMTITIESKDSKMRCTINQLAFVDKNGQVSSYFDAPGFLKNQKLPKNVTEDLLSDAHNKIVDLIANFNRDILSKDSDK